METNHGNFQSFSALNLMNYYFVFENCLQLPLPCALSRLIITSHNNLAKSAVDYLSENVNSICYHQAKIAHGEAFSENYVKISDVRPN